MSIKKNNNNRKSVKKLRTPARKKKIEKKEIASEILIKYNEKIESDKKLMMWAGVTFFMALILFFWALNVKTIFRVSENNNSISEELNFTKIADEFNKAVDQAEEGWNEFKNENNKNINIEMEDLDKENIVEFKEKLKELEEQLNAKNNID